ncbi:Cytochrome P450 2J5 [Bulinus truncatus]|nr:Cytochrome P450 2J5 [Bulinus truncatus]
MLQCQPIEDNPIFYVIVGSKGTFAITPDPTKHCLIDCFLDLQKTSLAFSHSKYSLKPDLGKLSPTDAVFFRATIKLLKSGKKLAKETFRLTTRMLTEINDIYDFLCVVLLGAILGWLMSTLRGRRFMPPGPFPFPVFGNLSLFADSDPLTLLKSLRKKYGKIFTIHLGGSKCIVINDLEIMQEAFVRKGDLFSNRPCDSLYLLKITDEIFGRGLILSDGEAAKEIRNVSLFALTGLGAGQRRIEEKITEEMKVVLEQLDRLDGQPYQIISLLTKATSNIMCNIIFHSRFSYDDPKFTKHLSLLSKAKRLHPLSIPLNFLPFIRFFPSGKQQIRNLVTSLKLTEEYIKTLMERNEETSHPTKPQDFVDLTILSKKGPCSFSESNMRQVIVDLFLEGSDFMAASLSWALLYMAAFPDVQLKCQQEIDKVINKGRPMTLSDKASLRFTEATLLEVLRLRPIAPLIHPHRPTEDAALWGYFIPKRAMITANIELIHRDPTHWPDPDKFQPEHFLDEEGNVVNRDKMVAFSFGPRSCLGENLAKMEMFIFFTSILQFFTVKPAQGKTIDLSPFNLDSLIFQPINQYLVFVKR